MKQFISLLLTIAALFALMSVPAFAADETNATFKLTCEFDKTSYNVGDNVTVKLFLQRTDSDEDFHLFSFSDTIMFNKLNLKYVDSSRNTNNIFRVVDQSVYMNQCYDGVSINYVYIGNGYSPVRTSPLMVGYLKFTALANIREGVLVHSRPSANVVSGVDNTVNAVNGTFSIGNGGTAYDVRFDAAGGTGSAPAGFSAMSAGDVFYIPSNTYNKVGFTFAGWSDGTKIWQPYDVYTMPNKAVTLTAQWDKIPVQHSAVFNGAGATEGSAPGNMTYFEGDKLSMPTKATLVRTGYTFNGWSYDGKIYQPGDTVVMPDADVTFAATWKSIETGEIVGGKADETTGNKGCCFTDVKSDAFYYDAVLWAVDKKVTSGTTATTFSPNMTCNRAQTVTFLWRAMGSPEPASKTNVFTDVATGAYYYKAVLWAVEKGITKGTSATTFSPNATVTRSQVAAFQWRAAGSPSASAANPFTDVSSDAYYYNAVLWAAENGITAGTTATTFAPADGCTRGQIVTFLYRQLGK